MKIVSLLPAATEIVCALSLQDQLFGISHGCYYPSFITTKPRVSYMDVDYTSMTSRDIDTHVENRMRAKKNLYHLDENLLAQIKPTHILTQALCDVCAITPSDIQKFIVNLSPKPEIIELNPRSLEQICDDVIALGKEFKRTKKAKEIVKGLKNKMKTIREKTQKLTPRTVFCLEWLDPLYACGHWVPEMVEIAGGHDPMSFPNAYSCKIAWEKVVSEDPEIMVIMACSFSIARTLQELPVVIHLPFWDNLRAVKEKNVWVVDGRSYFNQSSIRTVDKGIDILAKIFHPDIFGQPTKQEAVNIAHL